MTNLIPFWRTTRNDTASLSGCVKTGQALLPFRSIDAKMGVSISLGEILGIKFENMDNQEQEQYQSALNDFHFGNQFQTARFRDDYFTEP
jgi:hypothetical protein